MADSEDVEFEFISSARQLGPPPKLRTKLVDVPDWVTPKGKGARFLVSEVTQGDYVDYVESGRTYEGNVARYSAADDDVRLLAFTVRDKNGNRIWPTIEAAKAQLNPVGKSCLNLLLNAANEINTPKPASAEKNFEKITSDSSPST